MLFSKQHQLCIDACSRSAWFPATATAATATATYSPWFLKRIEYASSPFPKSCKYTQITWSLIANEEKEKVECKKEKEKSIFIRHHHHQRYRHHHPVEGIHVVDSSGGPVGMDRVVWEDNLAVATDRRSFVLASCLLQRRWCANGHSLRVHRGPVVQVSEQQLFSLFDDDDYDDCFHRRRRRRRRRPQMVSVIEDRLRRVSNALDFAKQTTARLHPEMALQIYRMSRVVHPEVFHHDHRCYCFLAWIGCSGHTVYQTGWWC